MHIMVSRFLIWVHGCCAVALAIGLLSLRLAALFATEAASRPTIAVMKFENKARSGNR